MALRIPSKGGSESNRRRSQRVVLTMPISIRSEGGSKNASFEEQTNTLVVNVHGALIALSAKVVVGQMLRMTNVKTKQEQVCRVVSMSPAPGGKPQVGVEFSNPSPDFWHISFPPEDWVQPEASTLASDD
jgi:hypothetical protein